MILSFVVPFYNVEKYIEQCIRSLYDQRIPMNEYEVICIDDCSPDGSRAIVEHLQKEFSNLRLISHRRNKRLGGARNTGLREAKGKYVWFIDSDDFVQSNCLNQILEMISDGNDSDIYHFNYLMYTDLEKVFLPSIEELSPFVDGYVYGGECFATTAGGTWFRQLDGVWRFIIKKSFLLANELFFEENVMYEDTDWLFNVLMCSKSVVHYSVTPYIYRDNPYSITKKQYAPQNIIWRLQSLLRSSRLMGKSLSHEYKNLIEQYLSSELSVIGKDVTSLSVMDKLKYTVLIRNYDIGYLFTKCSLRNKIRIKFAI